jgi:hypothetical protein
MKSLTTALLIAALFIGLLSCDDSFNPKGEFEEGYTLYCILDGNSSHQEAYLFKNYDPEGFDAASYNRDRTVPNAVIKILDGNTEYVFKDTSEFKESLGYTVNYYKLDDFNPGNYSSEYLIIDVKTADGENLAGATQLEIKSIIFSASTKRELKYDPLDSLRVLFGDHDSFQFIPFLYINYRIVENGDTSYFQKEIPTSYINEGEKRIPIYPDYKRRNYFRYSIGDIAYEIEELAKQRNPGSKMKMLNLTLGVLQVTSPLDIYYQTYKAISDGFSIKMQKQNISNITNASGIFAYKQITSVNILFRREWNNFFSNIALEQL